MLAFLHPNGKRTKYREAYFKEYKNRYQKYGKPIDLDFLKKVFNDDIEEVEIGTHLDKEMYIGVRAFKADHMYNQNIRFMSGYSVNHEIFLCDCDLILIHDDFFKYEYDNLPNPIWEYNAIFRKILLNVRNVFINECIYKISNESKNIMGNFAFRMFDEPLEIIETFAIKEHVLALSFKEYLLGDYIYDIKNLDEIINLLLTAETRDTVLGKVCIFNENLYLLLSETYTKVLYDHILDYLIDEERYEDCNVIKNKLSCS